MLPIRWSQPPCMNIDVISEYHDEPPRMQTVSGPSATRVPGGASCSNSAGMRPS